MFKKGLKGFTRNGESCTLVHVGHFRRTLRQIIAGQEMSETTFLARAQAVARKKRKNEKKRKPTIRTHRGVPHHPTPTQNTKEGKNKPLAVWPKGGGWRKCCNENTWSNAPVEKGLSVHWRIRRQPLENRVKFRQEFAIGVTQTGKRVSEGFQGPSIWKLLVSEQTSKLGEIYIKKQRNRDRREK